MEGKILLYDENDTPMGETFMRRAHQLVKRQRASWVDESHNAIRFASGAEDDIADITPDKTVLDVRRAAVRSSAAAESFSEAFPSGGESSVKTKNALYALAKKRIVERQLFYIHSAVAAFIMAVCIYYVDDNMRFIYNDEYFSINYVFTMFFVMGANAALYAVHLWVYCREHFEKYNAKQLSAEVKRLKRLGHVE